jgi:TP901 family phage tail tape measure protein
VFVEIGADPRKFFSALNKVNKSLASMGGSLVSGGGKLAAAGIGMAAPIAAAVRQGAAFESTLLNIRASTGATSAQIDQIKASSMAMSQALGVGPTEAAQGMLELLKAGMSLDAVLGGAGKTAMEFAKVGEMDVAQASVVMSDAMNVFKVSSDVAANALSSAADASSTSIAQMSEAFSMSSAVAGKAGLSIQDLSATLAILANNGVKGSDAGTSVKTMLRKQWQASGCLFAASSTKTPARCCR